jgi:hypothetical protein
MVIGPPGTSGSSFLAGLGAPSATLGITGDTYLDKAASLIYTKTALGWGVGLPFGTIATFTPPDDLIVAVAGQTSFAYTHVRAVPQSSWLTVNAGTYRYVTDYVIDNNTLTLTWIGPFALSPTDSITLYG